MKFIPCEDCSLRRMATFKQFTMPELAFVRALKSGQVDLPARHTIIRPGLFEGRLYTLYAGWAFRYRETQSGQRHIVDVLLPGSLLGLQQLVLGSSESGVESLTPVTLCVLAGRTLNDLFAQFRDLTGAMVHAQLEDERRGDTRQALISRQNAPERLAFFLLELFDRLEALGMASDGWCYFPLQRRHLADALGLSDTHVSRSMRELRRLKLASISSSALKIVDRKGMSAFAGYRLARTNSSRLLL